jgi:hypothetical protein
MAKYNVSFWVTDVYPEAQVEAGDRNEAIKLYQDLWKNGKLAGDILKDARYSVMSVKPKK